MKFVRGAENQSFLVEAVTGVETIKALAVEPQAQNRWDKQLAGYIQASFRASMLANWARRRCS
jgi:subfamily B ATP-binding cassette protein HlyB/CyaB